MPENTSGYKHQPAAEVASEVIPEVIPEVTLKRISVRQTTESSIQF